MKEIVAEPLISPQMNESLDQQDYSLDVMTSTPTTPNSAHLLAQSSSEKSNQSTSEEEPEDDYPGRNLSIEDTDLVLCDLSLDRSDDASPTEKEPPVSPIPDPVISKMPSRRSSNSKSISSEKLPAQTRRYPSFRDIFLMPLRSKRRSTHSDVNQSTESAESTKKSKQGCGGWLDKKKKKSKKIESDDDENLSEESPPPLVRIEEASVSTHLMMQCSKCSRLEGRPANLNIHKGATFTKCPLDGEWLCDQCADREEECEWASKDKVPRLAYLAIDVLKIIVSRPLFDRLVN